MSGARALGVWLACTACQTAPSKAPAPPIVQVVVPVDGDVERGPGPAGPTRFSCVAADATEPTRIEFEVSNVTLDGHSAPARTRATYRARLLRAGSGPRRAEVVLEALLVSSTDSPRSAWSIALEREWIEMRRAFVLQQQSKHWCFADGACDDAEQREVARAIGETLELLQLPELIATELDGRPSDGSLELELPALLLERLQLASTAAGVSTRARQVGRGFPARFVTSSEPPTRAHGNDANRVSARISVTQRCALAALEAELSLPARGGSDAAPSGAHRFSWRFELAE